MSVAGTGGEERSSRRGGLARYWLLFIVFGAAAGIVVLTNWWQSPQRQFEAALDGLQLSKQTRGLFLDLFTSMKATGGGESGSTHCARAVCYAEVGSSLHRFDKNFTPEMAVYVNVEAVVHPIAANIRKYLPTEYGWILSEWRWSVQTSGAGQAKQVYSGNWEEIHKVPNLDGQGLTAKYIQALRQDLEQALRKELELD